MNNFLPLDVRCKACKKVHTREVSVIEPEKFSPKGTKSVMSQFWCPYCKYPNAIRYAFSRAKDKTIKVRIKTRVDPIGMPILHGDETAKKDPRHFT